MSKSWYVFLGCAGGVAADRSRDVASSARKPDTGSDGRNEDAASG
jgi:hypothetical protein